MNNEREDDASGKEVTVHVRDPWTSAPMRLLEGRCGLTPEARLVLVYMLGLAHRPNWKIRLGHVRVMLEYGDKRWRRVINELKVHKYFRSKKESGGRGKWKWTFHVYDSPDAEGGQG